MTSENTMQIRQGNINRIRRTMLTADAWTKDSLAAGTGLSPATCRNILMQMLGAGEAFELPLAASCGGRPARQFQYNRSFILFALVQIKYTYRRKSVNIRIVDTGGRVLKEIEKAMENVTADALLDTMEPTLKEFNRIKVIAVSYSGVVLNGRTGCWSDVEELSGIDLSWQIEQRFQLPVVIENDVNLAAWGYAHETGIANLAYIAFPKGNLPGCGLIVDGRLLRGTHGFAGEVLYIQNQTWDEQRRRMETLHGIAEMILQMLRPITALLDPEKIIIAGDDISDDDHQYIQHKCRTMVRNDFLPELVFLPSYLRDNFAGMLDFGWQQLATRP